MVNKLKNLLFQNRSQGQIILKNVFWLSAGQIGSRLFRVLIIIYAARTLGAAEYGLFSYVLGLAGFFTVFADIGLTQTLTREAAKNQETADYFFSTIFWLKILLLLLTALLLIFLAPFFSNIKEVKTLLPMVALLNFFDGLRDFCGAFFRAKQKMEFEALLTTLTNVAITIFGFTILHFSSTARALTITYILSAGTGTVAGIILLRKNFAKVIQFFRKDLVKEILKISWPIALISAMGIFMLNTDLVMLGFFRTKEEIGFYSAGQKIVQLLYVLPAILASVLFPVFSRFAGLKEKEKSRELLELGVGASLALALPIALDGLILGGEIIKFLYGPAYNPAILSFQILILTVLITFPGAILGNYVFAHNQQNKMPLPVLVGSLGNIFFNALLIPPFGIYGAALATLLIGIIYNGLVWRLAKTITPFFILPYLKKIFLAAAAMGAVTIIFQKSGLPLIPNTIISFAAYLIFLYLLKEGVVLEIINLLKR